MKINEANIVIARENKKLVSVSIEMPIWDKIGEDNFVAIHIPLLAANTFAKNENEIDIAVNEVIESFCILSEKFGKGLETELKLIGWGFDETTEETTKMSFNVNNSVFDQVLQTGDKFVKKLEIA